MQGFTVAVDGIAGSTGTADRANQALHSVWQGERPALGHEHAPAMLGHDLVEVSALPLCELA